MRLRGSSGQWFDALRCISFELPSPWLFWVIKGSLPIWDSVIMGNIGDRLVGLQAPGLLFANCVLETALTPEF
jgi:hypothetical protein